MQQYQLNSDASKKLAEDHVDWFLKAIRPLLIDNFVHGVKHGLELAIDEAMKPRDPKFCDCDLCRDARGHDGE